MKRPAPTRPPPPPPVPKSPPSSSEPLYASVNKDSKKPEILRNLPPLPVRPPRPPSPNLIHSPPPPPLESPIHSNSVTVTGDASFSRDFIVTCADIHAEDYATSTYAKNGGKMCSVSGGITPTNETNINVFKKVFALSPRQRRT